MIQKQRVGKHFGGVVRYCLDQSRELGHEGAHVIETDLAGRDARELTRELEFLARANPRVRNVVYHCSLRLAPGERLSDERWREISRQYLERMGFGNAPYLVVAHPAARHDATAGHVHLIASRVDYEGRCVSDSWERYRSNRIVRELEREHHLEPARSKDRQYGREIERTRER